MMILRHFDDQEHDGDASDDSAADQERQERDIADDWDKDPDDTNVDDEPENNKKAKTEKDDTDTEENTNDQSNNEEAKEIENKNKVQMKPNGMNIESEKLGNAKRYNDTDDEKAKNGLEKCESNHEDMKMSVDGESSKANSNESSKANSNENIFENITPEESKSSDLEDIVMAGDIDCDKSGNNKKEDSESDYESGEEVPDSQNTEEDQPRNSNPPLDIERILALNVQRVRERITSELGALGPHDNHEVNPPDAPPFDTDDDDDDHDMHVDFLESLKRQARSSCPPRKLRYSSNTSVDTSTTSGIGSYTDDHLDAEMASHMNDSQKTSPGTVSMDGPAERGKTKRQPMDCSDSEEEDKEEESFPKETLGKFLAESVEALPLPTALRSYVMYYRN